MFVAYAKQQTGLAVQLVGDHVLSVWTVVSVCAHVLSVLATPVQNDVVAELRRSLGCMILSTTASVQHTSIVR